MNNIVRAWKDAAYHQSLSAQEQAMLPANPAGEIELTDAELEAVFGADGGWDGRSKNLTKIDEDARAVGTADNESPSNGLLGNVLNGNNIALGLGVLGGGNATANTTCTTTAANAAKTDEY